MSKANNIEDAVRSEYQNIDSEWMKLHIFTHGLLSLVATILEISLFFVLVPTNIAENSGPLHYTLKYVLFPSGCDWLLVLSSYIISKSKISMTFKYYYISISFVASAFIISMVHGVFSVIYAVFILPIIMTVVYGAQRVSFYTFLSSVILAIVSGALTRWDTSKTIDTNYLINLVVMVLIICCIYLVAVVMIFFEKRKQAVFYENDRERQRLREETVRDDLTGVYNKSALRDKLDGVERSKDYSTEIHIAMFDLDNFKKVNDNFGHLKGDALLKDFGQILLKNTDHATAYRFGGDEFCVVFEDCPLHVALNRAKQIHHDFRCLNYPELVPYSVTLSVGIASYYSDMSVHDLIEHADEALYQSKSLSKNRISIYKDDSDYKSLYLAKRNQNT